MDAFQKTGFDRRTGRDRRILHSLDYLSEGMPGRRQGKELKIGTGKENRLDWPSVNKWLNVPSYKGERRKHYIIISVSFFLIGVAFLFIFFLFNCASINNGILAKDFDVYNQHFYQVTKPTTQMIDTIVTVRIRLFGNNEDKQAAWNKEWRSKYPQFGPVQWACVSSDVPEIWGDLREVDGRPVVNILAGGHEIFGHIIKLKEPSFLDPDALAKLK